MCIAWPLYLWKLNLWSFMAVKKAYTNSTGSAWKWGRLDLIFTGSKKTSMSIAQPLELWKVNFGTFPALYNLHRTSTAVKKAFSDFPSTLAGEIGNTQNLQCWRLNFRTCTALKQACTTSTRIVQTPQDFHGREMAWSDIFAALE